MTEGEESYGEIGLIYYDHNPVEAGDQRAKYLTENATIFFQKSSGTPGVPIVPPTDEMAPPSGSLDTGLKRTREFDGSLAALSRGTAKDGIEPQIAETNATLDLTA